MTRSKTRIRNLHLVLGDQLDRDSAVFDGFDQEQDAVWMAEVHREASHVWCHKLRLAFFFSAMRHFRDQLRERGVRVFYQEMTHRVSDDRGKSLAGVLITDVHKLRPEKLIIVQPGDFRVAGEITGAAESLAIELEVREDRHFYDTTGSFNEWADGRKKLVLENYYRHLRKRHGILIDDRGEPEGGEWNFDKDNRESFGSKGPGEDIKAPRRFGVDDVSRRVIAMIEKRFPDHPGSLDDFDLPVTRSDALAWLREFVKQRLGDFGRYQDAMWTDQHFLYHSRLSCLLNVKLLNPRECIEKALAAYRAGEAPINSVEGFVRQVLGWREFVRGIYWMNMPGYLEKNSLSADAGLPDFFWNGDTDMACVGDAMQNVIRNGYAHHIQRLMILGLFALLYGVNPRRFHDWHMAMYLDAIDWVSAPNTIGMSQYGDGGIVGSKPYCASGKYINRMSNYCKNCRYDPTQASGENACPFTTFYWDFLGRNLDKIEGNRRMTFQVRNYQRKNSGELSAIARRANELREQWSG